MTLIRRLALRTLNAIVRHTPPGIGDWGRAALREMDFIENDWRALFWAMGSVTLLFQPEVKTIGETFDIPRKTQWLKKQIRRRTILGSVLCFFLALCFAKFSLTAPNSMSRIGAILTVVSMLFLEYQVHHWRGRAWPHGDVGTSDLQSFFRNELER